MARLLAAWELGLGRGHLASLAPAARGLAALGHESWLAARDVTVPAQLPDRPFAGVVPAPLWLGPRLAGLRRSYGEVIADAGFGDDEGLIEIVRAWLAIIGLVQPAGLYGDHAPGALLAAHVGGLPAIRLGSPFTCPEISRPMPRFDRAEHPKSPAAPHPDTVIDRVIRGVCRHFGAPMLAGVADLLATAPRFLTSWPELEPAVGGGDSGYGPLTGIAATAVPDWPAGEGPKLFVYLDFDRPAAKALAAVLGRRGWPVLWVSARQPDFALGPAIRHEVEPVDIMTTLAGVDVIIGRGGHGLCLDALRAGRPQLLLPDTQESLANAEALAARGLARLVTGWDEASLAAGLDALANPAAAEHTASRAAARPGYDPAAATSRLAADIAQALRLH